MAEFDQYRLSYGTEIDKALAFSGKSQDFFLQVKAERLLEMIEPLRPTQGPLKLLDVGCGGGAMHGYLTQSQTPLAVTGIEVAGEYLPNARAANPTVTYELYDGQRIPYDTGSFDAAFTVCVMHHVPQDQWPAFLAEMRRITRPGGMVIVMEHNPINPVTAHIVRTCPWDKNAVLLPPAKLAGLMEEAGLADVKREFILFTPFAHAAFRQLDRALSWLPLGAQYVCSGHVPSR